MPFTIPTGSDKVPYSGATGAVDLGTETLTSTGKGTFGDFLANGEAQLGDANTDNHGINAAPVANQMLTADFAEATANTDSYFVRGTQAHSSDHSSGAKKTFGYHFTQNISGTATTTTGKTNYGLLIDQNDSSVLNAGAMDYTTYGVRVDSTFSGTTTAASAINQYAAYFQSEGDLGTAVGPTAHFGIRGGTSDTADVNYGGWFAATGATTNYGVWVDAGDVVIRNDDQKIIFGAALAADSYIQFGGTNLEYFSAGGHDFLSGDIITAADITVRDDKQIELGDDNDFQIKYRSLSNNIRIARNNGASPILQISATGDLALNEAGFNDGGTFSAFSKVGSDILKDIYTAILNRSEGGGGVGLSLGYLFRLENAVDALYDAGRFKFTQTDATSGAEIVEYTLELSSGGGSVDTLLTIGNGAFTIQDVITTIGDGGSTNYVEFSATGDQVFVGSSGLCFAEIFVQANNTADTVATATNTQVTRFAVDGVSNNMTPDHANDHITVTKAGMYLCMVSVSFAGDANVNWGFSVYKNDGNTEFTNVHSHRKLNAGGDIGSISMSGIIDLAVNDTIEVWMKHAAGVNKDITVEDITMSLVQIGGT